MVRHVPSEPPQVLHPVLKIGTRNSFGQGETVTPPATLGPLTIPQGLTGAQFDEVTALLHSKTAHIGGDIIVQGSRAVGTEKPTSDIDFGIRVSQQVFDALIQARFGNPTPGTAKERTMQHAIETGKIQTGEVGLRGV